MVPPASHQVSRALWYSGTGCAAPSFAYRTFTPFGPAFQRCSARFFRRFAGPQPRPSEDFRFGLFPVRSPLLRESFLFSFPPGTKMFQFPGFSPHELCIHSWVTRHYSRWVSPFGDLRIEGRLRLPGAYRSLPRPSSTSCAKASAVRPRYLVHYLGRQRSNYF